jgi:hypothetical protein
VGELPADHAYNAHVLADSDTPVDSSSDDNPYDANDEKAVALLPVAVTNMFDAANSTIGHRDNCSDNNIFLDDDDTSLESVDLMHMWCLHTAPEPSKVDASHDAEEYDESEELG